MLEENVPLRAFWLKPLSTFGLIMLTMFKRQFTYVGHTTKAYPPIRMALADIALPHGSA